jgi:outer membrane protein OmpA-like peptidoglycan-associated protein
MRAKFFHILTIFACFILASDFLYAQDSYQSQKRLSIYFDSDKDEVSFKSRSAIRSTILEIGSLNIKEIYVEGHTDSDASDQYNIDLSKRRAQNTEVFLKSQGVKEQMIHMESFGERKPVGQVKAKNRRVEITFVYEVPIQNIGKERVLIIKTVDALTQKALVTSYVYQKNNHNIFGQTNAYAYTRLVVSLEELKEVVFSKDGYLSASPQISMQEVAKQGDTIRLTVPLNPVQVVEKIRYNHIYFYTDTDRFKPEAKRELNKLLAYLKQNTKVHVEIQGHMNFPTNRIATKNQKVYNQDLSHNRAKAVYTYLIQNGIDKKRLTYKGLSNSQMIFPLPKNTEEADQNKRVEVWSLEIIQS